jgi:hypothetical protein
LAIGIALAWGRNLATRWEQDKPEFDKEVAEGADGSTLEVYIWEIKDHAKQTHVRA